MKSASYKRVMCNKCHVLGYPISAPRGPLYAAPIFGYWVMMGVEASRYIWELGKGCKGCCEVLEDRCRVLVNVLIKVEVVWLIGA